MRWTYTCYFALYRGNYRLARYLIDQGATTAGRICNQLARPGYTAFHYATSDGNLVVLQTLLEQNPEALLHEDAVHPVHLAVANGHVEWVEYMIEHTRARMLARGVYNVGPKPSVSSNAAPLYEKALHHLLNTQVCTDGRIKIGIYAGMVKRCPASIGAQLLHISPHTQATSR